MKPEYTHSLGRVADMHVASGVPGSSGTTVPEITVVEIKRNYKF